jgi:hypothetical protein
MYQKSLTFLDRKYRVIFIVVDGEAEVITVTNHYQDPLI